MYNFCVLCFDIWIVRATYGRYDKYDKSNNNNIFFSYILSILISIYIYIYIY